jgi:hypothetical protein
MRWFKNLLKGFTFSTMSATALLLAAGGIGCGDESFKFCECKFSCTANYPDPANPGSMITAPGPVPLTICDEGEYTYSDCGVFCKATLPPTLPALETTPLCACQSDGCGTTCYDAVPGVIGAPTMATLSMCTGEPQSLAKNSCSPGTPVGE